MNKINLDNYIISNIDKEFITKYLYEIIILCLSNPNLSYKKELSNHLRYISFNKIIGTSRLINENKRFLINEMKNLFENFKTHLGYSDKSSFITSITLQRNWRESCCICLEKIIGTACTCGHFEVILFDPCGHSICFEPCSLNFKDTKCPLCREEIKNKLKVTDNQASLNTQQKQMFDTFIEKLFV